MIEKSAPAHAPLFDKYDCQMACFPKMQSTPQTHAEKIRDQRERRAEVMASLPSGSILRKRNA